MEELSQILGAATSSIEHGHFRLNIQGGSPVYRERVYCYELYHQMRSRWPANTPYYLNGEIDKAAHPILSQLGADRFKPDLLVHQPGYMTGNHAIIEVKTSHAPANGIRKDLETLSLFINKVGYQRAIYLFYGDNADSTLVKTVQRLADAMPELAPIELWLHHQVGQPARHSATLGNLKQLRWRSNDDQIPII